MTTVQEPDAQNLDPKRRRAVSEYERTIATLASAAGTRTYLSDAPPEGVSGCYDYQKDRIILYPAVEALNTTTVALEEAGHSQQREVYQKYHIQTVGFSLAAAPLNARGLLDWLEDWRVFTLLEERFPGAARLFREHWELRVRYCAQQVDKHPQQAAVFVLLGEIAGEALRHPRRVPKTYEEVLRRAFALLKRLSKTQAQQQDQQQCQGADDSGAGDGGGANDGAYEEGDDTKSGDGEGSSADGATGVESSNSKGDGTEGQQSEQNVSAGENGDAAGRETDGAGTKGAPDAPGGRSKIGAETPQVIPEELAPFILGVMLLATPKETEARLLASQSWRYQYQRATFYGQPWKTLDSAILEVEE